MKDRRERQIQKIEAERNALPDIQMLEKTVEETAEKVAELRRVLEEACQSAETASPLSREYPMFKFGISVTTRLRDFIPN
jgi:RNase adaptor protein for sRNA GlmZ degradation